MKRTTAPGRIFPFAALEGQALMRRALLANALCPDIGGVLLRGQKGTAKSTAVRALARLLPSVPVVADCPWRCSPQGPLCPSCAKAAARGLLPTRILTSPLVELPLSATEDRLTGSLDMEAALREGRRRFEPGLLAAAHRGVLYVDEVNLLPDHLVDMLLDACADGVCRARGHGPALEHPARFALIGSMNPEEGPLRPQLLDRFGLCVDVLAPEDMPTRLEILRRREAFDDNPAEFLAQWEDAQQALAEQLRAARRTLDAMRVPEARLRDMADLAARARCAGQRGELALLRAARALAALDGCAEVRDEHVREAAAMALAHRRRTAAPSPRPDSPDRKAKNAAREKNENPPVKQNSSAENAAPPAAPDAPDAGGNAKAKGTAPAPSIAREQVFAAGEPYLTRSLEARKDRRLRSGSGRRSRSRTKQRMGRCVGHALRPSVPGGQPDLALLPTLRAAALREARNGGSARLPLRIRPEDWRHKKRERKLGNLIVFAVDASGSMGAADRMGEAKSAVLSLLLHAYQKRDQVSLVAFRGQEGKTLLPPTGSVELACDKLEELPTGGRTPLAAGLREARRVIDAALRKNPDTRPILLVISDGRANVTPPSARGSALDAALAEAARIGRDERVHALVVDVEHHGLLQFGQARQLASALRAGYLPVEDLRAATLVGMVRGMAG